MISCIEWIPKGVADPNPKRYELSKAERELLESDVQEGTEEIVTDEEEMDQDNQETNDHTELLASQEKSASEIIASQPLDPSSLPEDLRMEDYSDDDSDDGAKQRDIGSLLIGNEDTGLGIDEDGNVEDDAVENDSEDEEEDDDLDDVPDTREYTPSDIKGLESMSFGGYTGQADFEIEDDDQEDSDADDTNLRPDDALVVVARVQEDFASLEINVYEETTGNLFVHHDIPLPAYPLCLAHGTINSDGGAGNYIAVGTFEPGIEIWNADILNALEPAVILGGEDTTDTDAKWVQSLGGKSQARPNMNKRNGLKPGSHTDAIMSLSWNTIHRQVIASGSADKTVKLWDVTKAHDANGGVAATLTHHTGKVQSTVWHPTEGTILATGSYDRTVAIVDARSTSSVKKVKIPADCESIAWDPHNPHLLTAASEDGSILCWDVRKFDSGKPYWSFIAHEYGGCSDISYNPNIPGMLATCAIDKTVALWDTHNATSDSNFRPFPCGNKDMNVGKLYCISFYPSSPWLLGCGGSGNQLALWNLENEEAFKSRFGDRVTGNQSTVTRTTMGQEENQPETQQQQEDFEAIMAASDQAAKEAKEKAIMEKKKKGKSKRKVHKKR